ncbi:hypothetical protein LIER_16872 [Lithospermum erythrorhizon]|uniref:DUF4283 domain-containing protein n=1 Tax=Lithospermum erythrorhizon TaxID=34254 RepID=A0AAV3Q8K7_LITER
MQADQVTLDTLPCWVQIWNLPLGFVNKEMGLAVGAHVGKVLDMDTRGLEQERGRYTVRGGGGCRAQEWRGVGRSRSTKETEANVMTTRRGR